MTNKPKNTEQPVSRRRVVYAVVHYSVENGLSGDENKTVTLQLRSLYEVAAIPDHLDREEYIDPTASCILISSMHIYDEIIPESDINYSLFN